MLEIPNTASELLAALEESAAVAEPRPLIDPADIGHPLPFNVSSTAPAPGVYTRAVEARRLRTWAKDEAEKQDAARRAARHLLTLLTPPVPEPTPVPRFPWLALLLVGAFLAAIVWNAHSLSVSVDWGMVGLSLGIGSAVVYVMWGRAAR